MSKVSALYEPIIGGIKSTYGRFWPHKRPEYYLKLDGYYTNKKQDTTMAVLQVRHKRSATCVPVKEIANDTSLIKELHPADACFVGLLANNERHGHIDTNCVGLGRMKRCRPTECFEKSEPLLQIVGKHFDDKGHSITVLYCPQLNQKTQISTTSLSQNQALLYALSSSEALKIGYDASELSIRQQPLMK